MPSNGRSCARPSLISCRSTRFNSASFIAFLNRDVSKKQADGEKSEDAEFPAKYFKLNALFNEYGWGESNHSTVPLPGKSLQASVAAYESRIAALCGMKPGMKSLQISEMEDLRLSFF